MEKNINIATIKPGDILLFPTKLSMYDLVAKKFGQQVADIQMWLSDQKYIHAEIVYEGNVCLAATDKGTYFVEHSMHEFTQLTIMRHVKSNEEMQEKIKQVIMDYWNIPYDYTSLIRNGIAHLGRRVGLERILQGWLDKLNQYDNKKALICSEVVARIYEEGLGLKAQIDKTEWTSPQDLRDSPYLIPLYISPLEQ